MRPPELIFLHSVSADGFDVPACDFQKLVALPQRGPDPYSALPFQPTSCLSSNYGALDNIRRSTNMSYEFYVEAVQYQQAAIEKMERRAFSVQAMCRTVINCETRVLCGRQQPLTRDGIAWTGPCR
jgi:hypothetical protein